MTDQTYNGWANFPTWKVNLEQVANDRNNYFNLRCWLEAILINKDSFNRSLKDVFADIIKRVVIHSDDHNYTNEFLKQVDWAEISESFISDYEEEQEQ